MALTYKGKTAADIFHGSTPIRQAYRGSDLLFFKGCIDFPFDEYSFEGYRVLKDGIIYNQEFGSVKLDPFDDWVDFGLRQNGEAYMLYNGGIKKINADVPFEKIGGHYYYLFTAEGDLWKTYSIEIAPGTGEVEYYAELYDPAGTDPAKSASTSRWDHYSCGMIFNEQGQGFIPLSQKPELLYDGPPAEWIEGDHECFIHNGRLCFIYFDSQKVEQYLRYIPDDPGGWQCVIGYPEGAGYTLPCLGIRDGELYRITKDSCMQKYGDYWEEIREIYNYPYMPQWDFPAKWQSVFRIGNSYIGVFDNKLIAFSERGIGETLEWVGNRLERIMLYYKDISCGIKWNTTVPRGVNIAVTCSGKLYRCVKQGVVYELIDPFTGRTIDA